MFQSTLIHKMADLDCIPTGNITLNVLIGRTPRHFRGPRLGVGVG